jgi:hypothetical protein
MNETVRYEERHDTVGIVLVCGCVMVFGAVPELVHLIGTVSRPGWPEDDVCDVHPPGSRVPVTLVPPQRRGNG